MRDEDFIRLEHKLDLIIQALQQSGLMIKDLPNLMGIEGDLCALCKGSITLTIDPEEGRLYRNCNCALPKRAYKLNLTTPTNSTDRENNHADNRTEEISISPDQEK